MEGGQERRELLRPSLPVVDAVATAAAESRQHAVEPRRVASRNVVLVAVEPGGEELLDGAYALSARARVGRGQVKQTSATKIKCLLRWVRIHLIIVVWSDESGGGEPKRYVMK